MLTFGGFLLLSGRLGDLFGNKRVFLGGVVSFTAASIASGIAPSPLLLVVGRAVQGLGGAAVSAVALALIKACSPTLPSGRRRWASSAS
jgi:MFS family permease